MAKSDERNSSKAALCSYESYNDYLFDELAVLDLFLESAFLEKGANNKQAYIASDLCISRDYISYLFSKPRSGARIDERLKQAVKDKSKEISLRLEATAGERAIFPLERLVLLFSLEWEEILILLLTLAPLIHSKYEKILAYLHDAIEIKLPSRQMVYSLLSQTGSSIDELNLLFSKRGALVYWGLIESPAHPEENGSSQEFSLSPEIAGYLLGDESALLDKKEYLSLERREVSFQDLPAGEKNLEKLRSLSKIFQAGQNYLEARLFLFSGTGEAAKYHSALALVYKPGLSLLTIDTGEIVTSPEKISMSLRRTIRDAILTNSALYFNLASEEKYSLKELEIFYTQLTGECSRYSIPVFVSVEKSGELPRSLIHQYHHIHFSIPDHELRLKIWSLHAKASPGLSEELLTAAANQFQFTEEQIYRALEYASKQSLYNEKSTIGPKELLAGCRIQSNEKLGAMGQLLETSYSMKDIILPADHYERIAEIAGQYRHKNQFYNDWGFGKKIAYGRGITVLFSGPSGTGKTMAASAMANELNLQVYKIDLSSVISKYIGETEKNLSRIFHEAATSNAILFFDEADAIFGKRTEVKDSHDRYANIEVSYLLQKMEEYEGVTILASNFRQNIDEAFTRRINFIVEFPFPDKALRKSIWERVFPKEAPLADDFDAAFLAEKLEITGGNIKSIASAAAFVAIASGEEISMKHIANAARREYGKLGKPFAASEFLSYLEGAKKSQKEAV